MGRYVFKLPDIGEGTAEAELVAWHVAVGDRVKEEQTIADVMTEKATEEIPAPVSGTVVELAASSLSSSVSTTQNGASEQSTRRAPSTSVSDVASTRTGLPSSSSNAPADPSIANP